jgi:hypothetical protein
MKENLVLDEKTDTLGTTTEEQELVINIASAPPAKHKKLIDTFLNCAPDKEIATQRLDEIFTYYYNRTRTVPIFYNHNKETLEKLFEYLEQPIAQFTFQMAFKDSKMFQRVVKALSSPSNGAWLEPNGAFAKKGKKRKAAAVLINELKKGGFLKDEIDLSNTSKVKYINDWFGIQIASDQSSTLDGDDTELIILFNRILKEASNPG